MNSFNAEFRHILPEEKWEEVQKKEREQFTRREMRIQFLQLVGQPELAVKIDNELRGSNVPLADAQLTLAVQKKGANLNILDELAQNAAMQPTRYDAMCKIAQDLHGIFNL